MAPYVASESEAHLFIYLFIYLGAVHILYNAREGGGPEGDLTICYMRYMGEVGVVLAIVR